jgi:hypothetical protein
VPLLLLELGSGVLEVLLAMLLTVVPAGAMKLMVRVVLAVLVRVTGGKVTIPVPLLYVPPSDTLTPVKPGMILSVIVTFSAVLGPMFCVVIV